MASRDHESDTLQILFLCLVDYNLHGLSTVIIVIIIIIWFAKYWTTYNLLRTWFNWQVIKRRKNSRVVIKKKIIMIIMIVHLWCCTLQVEMLQMKAENERMQRTITHNGLKEVHSSPTEDDIDAFKKKLSIGDPTTFGELRNISLCRLLDLFESFTFGISIRVACHTITVVRVLFFVTSPRCSTSHVISFRFAMIIACVCVCVFWARANRDGNNGTNSDKFITDWYSFDSDAIALESGNKDGQVFNVCVKLRPGTDTLKQEQVSRLVVNVLRYT